ncbi:hypothetical protein GEMRC1_012204 [Eukaryota sp. GEM-RC1]
MEASPSIAALLAPALSGYRPITTNDLQCTLDLLSVCEGLISRLPSDLAVKYQLVKHHIASKLLQSGSSVLKAAKLLPCNKSTQAVSLLRSLITSSEDPNGHVTSTRLSSICTSEDLVDLTATELAELSSHAVVLFTDCKLKLEQKSEEVKNLKHENSSLLKKVADLRTVLDQSSAELKQSQSSRDHENDKLRNELSSLKDKYDSEVADLDSKWKETVKRYRVKLLNWHEQQLAQVTEKYEQDIRLLKRDLSEQKALKDFTEKKKKMQRKSDSDSFKSDSTISLDDDVIDERQSKVFDSSLPLDLPLLTPEKRKVHSDHQSLASSESESDSEAVRKTIDVIYPKRNFLSSQKGNSTSLSGLEATKFKLQKAMEQSKQLRHP